MDMRSIMQIVEGALMETDDVFLNTVIETVTAAVPQAQEIWLHGSRATGKAKRSSDWDFLVVVPEDIDVMKFIKLATHAGPLDIPVIAGKKVDLQPAKPSDFEDTGSVAYWAKKEGRCVWRRS